MSSTQSIYHSADLQTPEVPERKLIQKYEYICSSPRDIPHHGRREKQTNSTIVSKCFFLEKETGMDGENCSPVVASRGSASNMDANIWTTTTTRTDANTFSPSKSVELSTQGGGRKTLSTTSPNEPLTMILPPAPFSSPPLPSCASQNSAGVTNQRYRLSIFSFCFFWFVREQLRAWCGVLQ